ncbi:hypothetical protein GH714_012576 [Hevea brasiliensis]|uniref:C2 domain-containing protein n=1 Tax=Hevea brasiliensis TaxID=3981 RepID=A0A6A6N2E2_HEVBR|nr:hypothetical protein GH714_012576 [Hevea brasiliensis]
MASSRPPSAKLLDLDLTIVSAKHLKNVNWKNGDLKAYAVFWVDPDRRLSTKSDDSGSTKPVWNERFTLPLPLPLQESYLTLDIFHSKPSETPKPLVGTLRVPLKELPYPDDLARIRTFELTRPSGRPQGKIRVKLGLRERPLPPPPPPPAGFDYHHIIPSQNYYYNTAPMPSPPAPRDYSYGGPSAPVDYSAYDQRQKGGKMGFGTGLAVGAVAGTLGGLALEEGLKYEEEKIADRVENDLAGRDDYSDYRVDY